jgi:hypothetical protein
MIDKIKIVVEQSSTQKQAIEAIAEIVEQSAKP